MIGTEDRRQFLFLTNNIWTKNTTIGQAGNDRIGIPTGQRHCAALSVLQCTHHLWTVHVLPDISLRHARHCPGAMALDHHLLGRQRGPQQSQPLLVLQDDRVAHEALQAQQENQILLNTRFRSV